MSDDANATGIALACGLANLSARAAMGSWEVRRRPNCEGGGYARIVAGRLTVAEDINSEEAAFVAALVNAYRSRALVVPGQAAVEVARPLSEWHEEIGDVLWWRFPIEEPPYCGSPRDVGRTIRMTVESFGAEPTVSYAQVGGWPGYHTHWTPLRLPSEPRSVPQPHNPTASQGEGIPPSSP